MGRLIGVVYDVRTLAPIAVVVPDDETHLDSRHDSQIGKGRAMAIIQAQECAGLSVTEAAYLAIRKHTGREPPPMDQVAAMDAVARGMTGAR